MGAAGNARSFLMAVILMVSLHSLVDRLSADNGNLITQGQQERSSNVPSLVVDSVVANAIEKPPLKTQPETRLIGRWIGNTWIPPLGWRYYGADELRLLYKDIKIWWFGDSMARRAAHTFYHIVNNTDSTGEQLNDENIIDINKYWDDNSEPCSEQCTLFQDNVTKYPPGICRPMPPGGGDGFFMLSKGHCAWHLMEFFEEQMSRKTTNVDEFQVFVLIIGAWETGRQNICNPNKNKSRTERYFELFDVVHGFTQKFPNAHIVWRTQGYAEHSLPPQHPKIATRENQLNVERILSYQNDRFSFIDWGTAVWDRSHGEKRIAGDTTWHYGVEPRVVLIQMLTNHLIDKGVLSNYRER